MAQNCPTYRDSPFIETPFIEVPLYWVLGERRSAAELPQSQSLEYGDWEYSGTGCVSCLPKSLQDLEPKIRRAWEKLDIFRVNRRILSI